MRFNHKLNNEYIQQHEGVEDIRLIHNELFINIKLLNYFDIRPGGRDELKLTPSAPMSQKNKTFQPFTENSLIHYAKLGENFSF